MLSLPTAGGSRQLQFVLTVPLQVDDWFRIRTFTPPQLNQEAAASLSRAIAGGTNLGAIEGDCATSSVPSHSQVIAVVPIWAAACSGDASLVAPPTGRRLAQICPHYRSNIDLRAHDTSSCRCYCHHPSTA